MGGAVSLLRRANWTKFRRHAALPCCKFAYPHPRTFSHLDQQLKTASTQIVVVVLLLLLHQKFIVAHASAPTRGRSGASECVSCTLSRRRPFILKPKLLSAKYSSMCLCACATSLACLDFFPIWPGSFALIYYRPILLVRFHSGELKLGKVCRDVTLFLSLSLSLY